MRIITLLTVALMALTATAQDGPTMGWSSWNTFGVNINETLIRLQANAMVSKGLKDVGYDHINIDDGFFGGRDKETGQLLIHPTRFPNGLKPVADYIHFKGLKAGIYSDAGCNTCGNYYNGDVLSVDVGFYNYDQHDADFYFKECGFDFIKVDFCGGDAPQNSKRLALDPQERYTAISQAIKNTGRDDVRLNVCRWNYPGTWVHDVAFSWRTTVDINDSWNSVKGILAENLYMSAYCYDGHFNDMDMLEVGRSLSVEEDKTHFGMWCIMCSPLLIGCNLTNINSTALNLLKNKDLIALNQDTLYQQAYVVALINGCHVLVKDLEKREGNKRAFAVYNPNDTQRRVTVKFADLCLGGTVRLHDAYEQKDMGEYADQLELTLPAHATRIFVAEADSRTERTRYEAETAYISDYQELKNNQAERTGIYEAGTNFSSGYKAGWLGCSEQNDLVWRDVYSQQGGEYDLTIGYLSGENRNITVSVNGTEVQTVNVNSGGWGTVAGKKLKVRLQKGYNVIHLSNPSSWMPDIDYIDLVCTSSDGIDSTPTHSSALQGRSYDLQGRPVKTHAKGIVIVDGKKEVVRP